ncbi:hypothetical protein ACHAP6_004451 [Verticillium nonalfalfae]
MFWRFGGYANISTIDTILEKPEFTVEDLLDESDLIQELKQHNAKLIDYLRQDEVLQKLLAYVVAPKLEVVAPPKNDDTEDEDNKGKGLLRPFSRPRASSKASESDAEEESEKKRNRYAYVAAEVLSSDAWSIHEAMMENQPLVRHFWTFLKRPTPLDPLQASYFTKVNEALFDKKTEEMIALLKSLPDATADLLRHVECPMIMDLLLKIIALDRTEGGHGIVEWLYSQDVIPTLLSCLGPEHNWVVQTAAGDFIKAIITISANASQNDQQCIGPNELTRQLVSHQCVEQLIKYMLSGGNPLTVGVGIVIEVIRKNNSDYDPDVGAETHSVPSSRDPIYLGTLLRLFAQHVPDFVNLIMHAPSHKQKINSTFGEKIEPLGFDRFKTCELMAELLHCSNMGLLNEVGSEEVIATRDAERQRLRTEGKLSPNRGEEAPSTMEDMTMRVSQSSPEEGRRLEVTNISDDDGFEEVEPSREMNEDTSHEFVKAEEEISVAPAASSFLAKNGDDFVDEPLSSPKPAVADIKATEPLFEDPDLVVAPLSPTKAKAAAPPTETPPAVSAESESKQESEELVKKPEEAAQVAANRTGETTSGDAADALLDKTTVQVRQLDLDKNSSASSDDQSAKGDETDSSVTYTPTVSEPEQLPSDKEPAPLEAAPVPLHVSNAADVPAPLFAKSVIDKEELTTVDKLDTDKPLPAPPVPEASTVSDAATPPGSSVEDVTTGETNTTGEAILRPLSPPTEPPAIPQRPEQEDLSPVVGDYLKMQFVEYRVVPSILSFFFGYPWNNFLHNVVYDIVQQVFNGPMDRGFNPTLAISLFEAADITTAIINGQLASDESQARMKTRMGYMGHLTLIAEEVVKFTERHPPELLSETVLDRVMDQNWISYVEGALAETRERDNAILGGVRPEVALGNRAGVSGNGLASAGLSGLGSSFNSNSQSNSGSNALAEAGLNGGLEQQDNNGIGPFAISAGTLMSGFGSSSDEDDDDADDNDEDVANEFRAYTDPLNNPSSSTSMNPPSIPPPPPPPPPLNIPPSRARLQLAARLAMHQKSSGGGDGHGDDGEDEDVHRPGSRDEPDRNRNPFADDEDDDVDSDDEDDGRSGGRTANAVTNTWGASARGSWWRGMVRRKQNERFETAEDSDSEREGDDDDEEFGDFAMPEVESAPGTDPNEKVLLKPLAVHPGGSQVQGKTAFNGLWPFGTKDEKDETAGAELHDDRREKEEGSGEDVGPMTARENRVQEAVEAKRRTSIEDPDEEEVVVQKPTSV